MRVTILAAAATAAATAAVVATAAASTRGGLLAYREGPPPGHTGGFGEPTCAECHFGGPVNPDRGSVNVEIPTAFEPGRTYRIAVALTHPDMRVAGYQLAVRFDDGPRRGEQAGTLRPVGPRTAVTGDTATGVRYAHQTAGGTALSGTGEARWVLEWRAPETDGDVAVHVAANAANDDASEFGDVIFTNDARIPVAAHPGPVSARPTAR